MTPKPRKSQRKRSLPRQTRSMMTFNVIAVVVVGALVFGAVGLAVFDDLLSGKSESPLSVDPAATDEIEQGYRDQVAANPNDAASISALANYLGNNGKVSESITWYEKALAITPGDMRLRLFFASALASGGKYRDSELQYQKVIAAEPENATALLGLARLYRSWSPPRPDDAARFYQQTIATGSDSVIHQLARQELAELTGTPVGSPHASPAS